MLLAIRVYSGFAGGTAPDDRFPFVLATPEGLGRGCSTVTTVEWGDLPRNPYRDDILGHPRLWAAPLVPYESRSVIFCPVSRLRRVARATCNASRASAGVTMIDGSPLRTQAAKCFISAANGSTGST